MSTDPMQKAPAVRSRGPRSQVGAGHDDGTSPSLFDAGTDDGRRRRDDGMRTAEHAAHPWVKSAIDSWIHDRVDPFTSDDLRADIEALASSPNVIGARINAAARRGEIVRLDFVQSTRPEAHGRWIKLWAKAGVNHG